MSNQNVATTSTASAPVDQITLEQMKQILQGMQAQVGQAPASAVPPVAQTMDVATLAALLNAGRSAPPPPAQLIDVNALAALLNAQPVRKNKNQEIELPEDLANQLAFISEASKGLRLPTIRVAQTHSFGQSAAEIGWTAVGVVAVAGAAGLTVMGLMALSQKMSGT